MLQANQLKKRQPGAWSRLLSQDHDLRGVIVTAVGHKPLADPSISVRYYLKLAAHPEPITLVAKDTNAVEAHFYRDLAPDLDNLTPHCWYSHIEGDDSWIVLDELFDDRPPEKWTADEIDTILEQLSSLHATYWDREIDMSDVDLTMTLEQSIVEAVKTKHRKTNESVHEESQPSTKEQRIELKDDSTILLSEQALRVSGRLVPLFTSAAIALEALQSVGGWSEVIGDQQISAMEDILDDPLPMLFPLRQSPKTLLHGNLTPEQWRLSIFDQVYLINWQKMSVGPAVYDLVSFIEYFEMYLGFSHKSGPRPGSLVTQETMEDSYILAMGHKLGSSFNASDFRQTIPAARCLFILTTWLPFIESWLSQIEFDGDKWKRLNQLSHNELKAEGFEEMVRLRPYLQQVFARWMIAYRSL